MRRRTSTVVLPIEALSEDVSPEEALRAYGLGVLRLVGSREMGQLHGMMTAASRRFPQLAKAFWNNGPGRGRAMLECYLAVQGQAGRLRIDDASEAAELFTGAIFGTVLMRASFGQPPILPDDAARQARVERAVRVFMKIHGPGS